MSPNRVVGWFERVLNPLCVKIGWRSDLSLEECMGGADLHVQYRFKMAAFDFWQIVVLGEHEPGVSRAAAIALTSSSTRRCTASCSRW